MAEKELFDWTDSVGEDVESKEFEVLPVGDYDFAVAKYDKKEKETKDGRVVPQVDITFIIKHDDGTQSQTMDFIQLTAKSKWWLSAFLRSVGVQKKGQALDMTYLDAFDASVGKEGRFKLFIDEYKGHKRNKVKQYYDAKGDEMAW